MRGIGGVLAVLFVVGLVVKYWAWILALVAIVFVVKWVASESERRRAAAQTRLDRDAQMIARAHMQEAWYLAGDPRGTFGNLQ